MRTRRKLMLSAAAALAATALGGLPPAGASEAAGASCPPIPAAQLHAILGLANSMQALNTVDDSGDVVRYRCNGVAWSGAAPTNLEAAFQTAKAGHGAAFGIEAWTPNEDSPYADQWPKDYDELTGGFGQKGLTFPGLFTNRGWPSKHLKTPHFGDQATGLVVTVGSGPAKGLVAAVGCWWNDDALSAVCLMVEEAAGRPVVKHLNQLAAIAVPKVL